MPKRSDMAVCNRDHTVLPAALPLDAANPASRSQFNQKTGFMDT